MHLSLEIPLNSGHGIHEVFRATPIPQPIPNTERATQYQLSKTHLLMSWDKTNFAEVTEQELSTYCWGSHCLRLCKQPFSTTRSPKTTCLTGLFFNLPATVLKLCAQEVIALPQHPQALYLYDFTCLLTSAKGDFVIQNVTPSGDFKMPGCQICLVRPTCNGRLQLPNAGLFLTPDPLSCLTESSKVVRILPIPLLRSLFDKLKEFEEVVAPELMGDFHQELLMHLKLNLAGLPDRSVTDEMLELIAQPFLQELKTVNTTLFRKVWRDVMPPCLATLLMLVLAAAVTWAARKGELYAVGRFIEGTQRDEGAAVPLADVVASATKEKDDVSQPLAKTTPGKAAAKRTAKWSKELKTFCSFLETYWKKKKNYIDNIEKNYLSKRYKIPPVFICSCILIFLSFIPTWIVCWGYWIMYRCKWYVLQVLFSLFKRWIGGEIICTWIAISDLERWKYFFLLSSYSGE